MSWNRGRRFTGLDRTEGEMQDLDMIADRGIRRGCGFAALGAGILMASLAFDPVLSLRIGGIIAASVWLVLIALIVALPRRDVRRMEIWIDLRSLAVSKRDGPELRRRAAEALRRRYLAHADLAAALAATLFAGAFVLALLR